MMSVDGRLVRKVKNAHAMKGPTLFTNHYIITLEIFEGRAVESHATYIIGFS